MRSQRSARTSVGWYSTARWLANHSSVRRSLHRAYDTSRFEDSAHSVTARHPLGGVLGQVLLHEGVLTPQDPDHRQRPVPQGREDPIAYRVEVVDQIALGRAGPVEQRLVEVGQRHAVANVVAVEILGFGCHRSPPDLASLVQHQQITPAVTAPGCCRDLQICR